jgi:hypothetical protein
MAGLLRLRIRKSMLTWICGLGLAACGSQNDSNSGAPRSGTYALGDSAAYEVTREGYGDLAKFQTSGKVIAVSGSKVQIEWRDLSADGLALIKWENGKNPNVEVLDTLGLGSPETNARECRYQPEEVTKIKTDAGKFTCLQYDFTCTKGEQSYHIVRCDSPSVALDGIVRLRKEFLNADGSVARWYQWDLTSNQRN